MSAGHPQVGQGDQRHQLCGVLHQPPETHLGVAKLPLDHAERVLNLGTHLSLGLLDLAPGLVQGAALAQLLVGATPRRDLPDDRTSIMLGPLLHSGITGVGTDHVLLAVQQLVDVGDIGHVGRRTHHAMHQDGLGIGTDVDLQSGKAEVLPLLPPLRTVLESLPSYGSSLPTA